MKMALCEDWQYPIYIPPTVLGGSGFQLQDMVLEYIAHILPSPPRKVTSYITIYNALRGCYVKGNIYYPHIVCDGEWDTNLDGESLTTY